METTEKKNILERIKTWGIIGLFIICFFGFMIFSYQYKSLNEKYEKAIKEQVDYQALIDSLLDINEKNDDVIKELNNSIDVLNLCVTELNAEKIELKRKLKESNTVISNDISVATKRLRENLDHEKL
jgi:hypothetical protein